MGTSTDAQICYGIQFEEDFEFPWGDDLEEWWVNNVLGYSPPFEVYDQSGNYIGGNEPPKEIIIEYFSARRQFIDSSPKCQIVEVNYCSADYPMIILAIDTSVIRARRGYPEKIDPSAIEEGSENFSNVLKAFCETHGIETDSEPAWFLCSYWG